MARRKSGSVAYRATSGRLVLKPEVWVKTVAEGGQRFMAAWRKEWVDAARHLQEKREATRLGTLLSHMEPQNFAKRYPLA